MVRSIHEAFLDMCRGKTERRDRGDGAATVAVEPPPLRAEGSDDSPEPAASQRSHCVEVGAEESGRSIHEHHVPAADAAQPRKALEPLSTATCCGPSLQPVSYDKMSGLPSVVRQMLEDYGEHFRTIALNLRDRSQNAGLKSLLVAGSLRGEGYTSVSIALAVATAELSWTRVLLLEADFTSPQLAKRLGLEPRFGFEDVLLDHASLEDAIQVLDDPPLNVLPLRKSLEHQGVLHSPRLTEVLDLLREHFDLIVIDGGSMFVGRGPSPLIAGIDAALIVRNPSKSSENLLEHLDIYLDAMDILTLGVVENCID